MQIVCSMDYPRRRPSLFLLFSVCTAISTVSGLNKAFQFTAQPVDTNATEGQPGGVLCECQAEGTYDLPFWYINGIPFSPLYLPPGYTSDPLGLRFPADPSFNGTIYQCFFLQIVNGELIEHMSTRGLVMINKLSVGENSLLLDECRPKLYGVSIDTEERHLNISWAHFTPTAGGKELSVDLNACPSVSYDIQLATCSSASGVASYKNFTGLQNHGTESITANDLEPLPVYITLSLNGYSERTRLSNETATIPMHAGEELVIKNLNQSFPLNHLTVCITTQDPMKDKCFPFIMNQSQTVEGLNYTTEDGELALYAYRANAEWTNWLFTVFAYMFVANCSITDPEVCRDVGTCEKMKQVTYSFKLMSHGQHSAEVYGTLVFLLPFLVTLAIKS